MNYKHDGIDDLNNSTKACDPPSDIVAYHRTTARVGDLVITYLEDGSIGLKRGRDTLVTTSVELASVRQLAEALRDYKAEDKQRAIHYLKKQIKHREHNLQYDKEKLTDLTNGPAAK